MLAKLGTGETDACCSSIKRNHEDLSLNETGSDCYEKNDAESSENLFNFEDSPFPDEIAKILHEIDFQSL